MTRSDLPSDRSDGAADWDAIARYLAGESDAAESAAVSAWLLAHPEDARAVEALALRSARLSQSAGAGVDVEGALQRMHERMRTPPAPVIPLRVPASSPRRSTVPWLVAAAAVLMLSVGIRKSRQMPTEVARYATAVGQTQTIKLPDGSIVVLGPASELRLDARFRDGTRDVQLRGTALFDVTHNVSHPFAVRAGNARITDVGTTFTVRGDGEDDVEVSVSAGAVRLAHAAGGSVELAAGDAAALQAGGQVVVHRAGASADDAAWTQGKLVFREAPIGRVRTDLRRWFGMELVVTDSTLAGRHLTAAFARDSREQVLEVIALALGATFEVKGDTVTLRPASLTVRPRK
jgi:transmembrane sensor